MSKQLSYLELAQFYGQFAQMQSAGVPLDRALEQAPTWVKPRHTQGIHLLRLAVKNGARFSEAMTRSRLFSYFDVALVNAGETSGKISQSCEYLSERYEQKNKTRKDILKSLHYPLFLLVAGQILFPLPDLAADKISIYSYLLQSVGVIALFSSVIYYIVTNFKQFSRDPKFEGLVFILQNRIPLVSGLLKRLALEEYFVSLALLIEAGVPIFEATKLSSQVSNHAALKKVSIKLHRDLVSGSQLSQAFSSSSFFPKKILSYIKTGEETGRLDEMLKKVADIMREQVYTDLKRFSKIVPKVIYLIVALAIAYDIISGYLELVTQLDALGL